MKEILDYSGITTKIKAKKGRLLTEDNFREMVALPDLSSFYSYVKALPGYAKALADTDQTFPREAIENRLENTKYKDFESIHIFANEEQRGFLKLYLMHYETDVIKRIINALSDGLEPDPGMGVFSWFFDKFSDFDLGMLLRCRTIPELIENLRGSEYYEVLRVIRPHKKLDTFDYEMALDFYYFRTIWNNKDTLPGDKASVEILADTLGTEFDMLNLSWIRRAKEYFSMSGDEIYAILIPLRYRLEDSELRALAESASPGEEAEILKKTYYGKKYKELTPDNIFRAYVDIPGKILKTAASKNPYSVATILNYLHLKEQEIKKIIAASECVRYGMSPQEAYNYVIGNNEVV